MSMSSKPWNDVQNIIELPSWKYLSIFWRVTVLYMIIIYPFPICSPYEGYSTLGNGCDLMLLTVNSCYISWLSYVYV
jgi:hypothetical protein